MTSGFGSWFSGYRRFTLNNVFASVFGWLFEPETEVFGFGGFGLAHKRSPRVQWWGLASKRPT
jgi:hypothetical protein